MNDDGGSRERAWPRAQAALHPAGLRHPSRAGGEEKNTHVSKSNIVLVMVLGGDTRMRADRRLENEEYKKR